MNHCDEFDDSTDPLDFETPGSQLRLAQTRVLRDFTITTDSYISLCSEVYDACCSVDPSFAANVSESVFQYYAIILLWKRFAEILPSSTKITSLFFTELGYTRILTRIPIPLQTYLKGVGDFTDPDLCDRRFVLPIFPNCDKIAGIPYTFGRINAKTHYFYEAFPAPGIAALRVQADIEYTRDPTPKNLFWDLPEELRPDIQPSHIQNVNPTKNLLGWAPAQRLSDNQLALAKLLNVNDNFMPIDYSSPNPFANVHGVFTKINEEFCNPHTYQTKYWVADSSPLCSRGSITQGMTIKKCDEFVKFDRCELYCNGNISVCSPYKSDETIVKGAVIAGFRMAKEPKGNRHCWACYDFDEYTQVPKSWINSRNKIYTYGEVHRLNETLFTTRQISKKILQMDCIRQTILEDLNAISITVDDM